MIIIIIIIILISNFQCSLTPSCHTCDNYSCTCSPVSRGLFQIQRSKSTAIQDCLPDLAAFHIRVPYVTYMY